MKPARPTPSSPLAPHILAFVAHKRALNRRYQVEERALRLFDAYLNEAGIKDLGQISPAIVEAFLLGRPRARPRSFNHLVGVVRRLFEWMVEHDTIPSSPVTTCLRRPGQSRLPFIFDLPAAQRLVDVASRLPDTNKGPLRGTTYATIFSLLFGLGLRVGEITRLRVRDVDRSRNILTLHETKFSKSRLIPLGPRLADRLYAFLAARKERGARLAPDDPVFSFNRGRPLHPGTISQTFHVLVPKLDLQIAPGVAPPTAHHLRHSFAVGRLLRWYREGENPAANLMKLSTFLGHVDPSSTAIYLTITAELLDAAAQRFESFASNSKCAAWSFFRALAPWTGGLSARRAAPAVMVVVWPPRRWIGAGEASPGRPRKRSQSAGARRSGMLDRAR
jgi:site-specific recombinase XerD